MPNGATICRGMRLAQGEVQPVNNWDAWMLLELAEYGTDAGSRDAERRTADVQKMMVCLDELASIRIQTMAAAKKAARPLEQKHQGAMLDGLELLGSAHERAPEHFGMSRC